MKRKVFFQNSWYFYFMFSVESFFEISFIGFLIATIFSQQPIISSQPRPYVFIMSLGGACLWGYLLIIWGRDRIVLEPNNIYVPDSLNKTIVKVQYRVEVDYTDISDIFLIETKKDSLNRNYCSVLPLPYIVINCKNGDQKLINVYWYSKKRKKAILDEIILRARTYGNDFTTKTGEELYNEFIVEREREYKIMKEERKAKRAARRRKKRK